MINKIKQAFLYGKDFCEDTAENIKETVVTAVDASKLHYRITAQRNELNALYASIGRSAYAELNGKSEVLSEEEISKLCLRIGAKEEIIPALEKQYRAVCGKVICPRCGKFISDKNAFCQFCGRATDIAPDYTDFDSDISDDELDELREIDLG